MNNKKDDTPKVNIKESLIKLLKYCKPYLPIIITSIILAILASLCSILGPNKLKELTNEITKGIMIGINMDNVKKIVLFLAGLYVLSFIFNYVQAYIMTITTNKISKKLRSEISLKINRLPLKYFDNNSYGDILSRVTNDADTIGQTLNDSIATLFSSIVMFVGVVIMMFVTNNIMAITAILSTLVGFVFMIIILSKSQKYFNLQQKELGNINGHIEEVYSGYTIVKAYNGSDEVNKKFDEINDKLYDSVRKSRFLSGLMPSLMGFIGNFSYVCICIVGATLVMNNKIEIGTIVAFMLYARLFTNPLVNLAEVATSLQSTAAATDRVFAFLEEQEMIFSKAKKELNKHKVKGNISFSHVNFSYDDNKPIINDFTAEVKSGEKIAIVGPTGAGKTTMVNLLMKFYDIKDGDIKIDGISTKDLSRENIHDLFIMILQDTWIFNGTIKDNIIYSRKGITDKQVIDVCKTVGLDHFIKTLPDGYDTILSDVDSLSAGEKQLLTIARGMLKEAPFLILDEATSSVDTRTELLVSKAMDKLTHGRTSFIIAHRLSTIKNANLILVMRDGNIVEQGTHEELLNKHGFYSELYNSQFEEVE